MKVEKKGKLRAGRGAAPAPHPHPEKLPSWGGRQQRQAVVAAAGEKMNLS